MPELTLQEQYEIEQGRMIRLEDACDQVVAGVQGIVRYELIPDEVIEVHGVKTYIGGRAKFLTESGYGVLVPFSGALPGAVYSDVSGIVAAVKRGLKHRYV